MERWKALVQGIHGGSPWRVSVGQVTSGVSVVRRGRLGALLAMTLLGTPASAQFSFPPAPGTREFIVDRARLISAEDRRSIVEITDGLLTDRQIPIVVVTIDSLAQYGASRYTVEQYARALFDVWGIGFEGWKYGMLLLVSQGDRRARIELGASWAGAANARMQEVMDDLIIPEFRRARFSKGVLAGVRGLDAIGRGLDLPARPRTVGTYLLWIGVIGLLIASARSYSLHGTKGFAWLFWSFAFGLLLFMLLGEKRSDGWSGGILGGGSGGGGGASGSW